VPDTPHNPESREWVTNFAKFTELNMYLNLAPHEEREEVQRELAALQDDLLDTPAPTVTAVQQKLEILWEGKMHGLDQDSEERRLILEDLEGLIQAQRELLGA
jgi:hypothetical protein